MSASRVHALHGPTYCVTVHDDARMYVTINNFDGRPFEVFVRLDDPRLYEWTAAVTLLITRALRAGESLQAIADELCEIASPVSGHHLPRGAGWSPSIVASLGRVLGAHPTKGQEGK